MSRKLKLDLTSSQDPMVREPKSNYTVDLKHELELAYKQANLSLPDEGYCYWTVQGYDAIGIRYWESPHKSDKVVIMDMEIDSYRYCPLCGYQINYLKE